jgi:hypothetical protein
MMMLDDIWLIHRALYWYDSHVNHVDILEIKPLSRLKTGMTSNHDGRLTSFIVK